MDTNRVVDTGSSGRSRAGKRAPFLLVSAGGLLGLLLPGGTVDGSDLWLAALGLALALLTAGVPWARRSSLFVPTGALCYLGFVFFLVQAQGGAARSGSFQLALVAVLGAALYGSGVDGVVIVLMSALSLGVSSAMADQPLPSIERKVGLWILVCGGLVGAIFQLRRGFGAAMRAKDAAINQAEALATALSELTTLDTVEAVLSGVTRLAAELASVEAVGPRRSTYYEIEDGTVRIASQFDESGYAPQVEWRLEDHPYLAEVVRSRQTAACAIDLDRLGPSARPAVAASGVTHVALVPVSHDGRLHGVLTVASRQGPISDHVVAMLTSVGRVMELAVDAVSARQALEHMARTDALTDLVNRRGLAAALPSDGGFAVIAADLDGLKAINDRAGHEAGDAALAQFAALASAVVRPGDVVARVGGDEFVVLLSGADEEIARSVSQRILDALSEAGNGLSASLGLAMSDGSDSFETVAGRADVAMYDAKREGGLRVREWQAEPVAG